MRAMILEQQGTPLKLAQIPEPIPGPRQVRLRVLACGLCRTDLHVVDGDLPSPKLPLVLGHQIVGMVDRLGAEVQGVELGDVVGVPWLGQACGACRYCASDQENLCDDARYTGYQIDGGLADYCVADAAFCFRLPRNCRATEIAPLLCAGLIGYRSLRMTDDAREIGFYGFGAAAHLLIQVARHQGRRVHAFTRAADESSRRFALQLGASWAGASEQMPPCPLDAAIIFAPIGDLVPRALRAVRKGGIVVCAGIHMTDIPSFPYADLWGERVLRSVANLTRRDGEEFLQIALDIAIRAQTSIYGLDQANRALSEMRLGRIEGAAVVSLD